MTKVLTIYKKPDCSKCRVTKMMAERLGYKVIEDELFNDKGELNTVPKFYHDTYNFTVSPIVTLSEDNNLVDFWCDFQITKLNEYAPQK